MMMNPRFASAALTVLAAFVAPNPATSIQIAPHVDGSIVDEGDYDADTIQIAPHVVGPVVDEVDYDPSDNIQIAPHVYQPSEEVERNPFDIDTIQIDPHIYATEKPEDGGNPCDADLTYFSSQVLVDFTGTEGSTEIQFLELEKIFRQAYNYLAEDLCDDSFRRIVDVSIIPESEDDVVIIRGGNQYSIRYAIEAVCRGCDPETTTLFSPPAQDFFRKLMSTEGNAILGIEESPLDTILQKRRLQSNSKSPKSMKSSKQSKSKSKSTRGGDFFTCDCTSSDPKFRAPTEEEFALTYISGIKSIEETPSDRRLETVVVDSIDRVTEIQNVTCTSDTETFASLIVIEFFGTYGDVTDQDRTMIEENLVFAYNGLQDLRCDSPVFRKATAAEVFFVIDPDTNDEDTFSYLLKVEGTCRGEGCSDGGTLQFFSDGETSMARHLQETNSTLEFVDGPECTCPVWGTEFGPPSLREMEMRYFQVIQDLRFKELITSIDASGSVQEVGPNGLAPSGTPAPSAPPQGEVTLPPFTLPETPAPTAAPVDTSAAPTDTSADASSAPTDPAPVPTFPPTSEPTKTPTVSPTRPITPSPTAP